jgi:D-3-phosphoglycerate dehydrogenase / 2-oxoglutarate reductase
MKRVLITEPLHAIFIEKMKKYGLQTVQLPSHSERHDVIRALSNVHGIALRSRFRMDREMIDAAPELQVIGRAGSGLELIDLNYANQKGIHCFNSPEGNCGSVAEHVVGMILTLMHQIRKADSEMQKGIFDRAGNWGSEIGGKTLGIVGLGHTGSALAQRLNGWNVRILAVDPYRSEPWPEYVQHASMAELQKHSDIVSFHVPLTSETSGIISPEWLGNLLKKPILVNAARGGLARSSDLADALEQGCLSGLCLDTFEEEAQGFEGLRLHSSALQRLAGHPKVVMTPHVAGWSQESWFGISSVLADKMISKLL